MKILVTISFLLLIHVALADSAKNPELDKAEYKAFRNKAMDIIDTVYCREIFKNYLQKKQHKAFAYITGNKPGTTSCVYIVKKETPEIANKIVMQRCERKRSKSKKLSQHSSACQIFSINHYLKVSRETFNSPPFEKDLFHAAQRYTNAEVEQLVEAGADIKQKNDSGMTPLLTAIIDNNADIVEYLVSEGADLTHQNNEGDDALNLATRWEHHKLVELLLSLGADKNSINPVTKQQAIHIAASNGNLGLIIVFLEKGVNVNQTTASQKTPLHFAAKNGYKPAIKYLIENGASINAKDASGKTPLNYAHKLRNKRSIKYLTDQGAKTAEML